MVHRNPDNRMIGLVLILLLVGQEAVRVDDILETETVFAKVEHTQERAANERELKRQTEGVNVESLIQEIVSRDIGRNILRNEVREEEEIARGKLEYSTGMFSAYKNVFTILRQAGNGKGYLDLYHEASFTDIQFAAGETPTKKPDLRVNLYADSFAGIEKSLGFYKKGPGIRIYGEYKGTWSVSHDDIWLKVLDDRPSLRVKKATENAWVPFDGRPLDLVQAWLQTIKAVQALDTGLTTGTSLVQCSYIKSSDSCTTPDFCTLQEKDRGHIYPGAPDNRKWCKAPNTARTNLAAWESFSAKALAAAKEIERSSCVSTCKSKWEKVMDDLGIISQLSKKFKETIDKDARALDALVIKEAAQKILATGEALKTTIVNSLSAAFDSALRDTVSPLKLAMKVKGCTDLQPGVLSAFLRLNYGSSGKTLEETKTEFNQLTTGCQWFRELAGSKDQMRSLVNAETDAEKAVKENGSLLQNMTSLERASLMEHSKQMREDPSFSASSALELVDERNLDPIVLAVIVCVTLFVVGLLIILLGKLVCRLRRGTKATTPAELCAQQEKVDNCNAGFSRVGTILFTAGIIVLVIIVVIAVIALAAASGGGGGGGGGGYHGGGCWGCGGFFWYSPPLYYHSYHHSPYYGSRLSDSEIAAFDYQRCVQESS